MARLDQFESRLQTLLENYLLKLLPGYKVEDGIALQLATAMKNNTKGEDGQLAPNIYVIVAHPSTLARWQIKPRFLKGLATAIYVAGQEYGFHFASKPAISTTPDVEVNAGEINIIASFSEESIAETRGVILRDEDKPDLSKNPGSAFLIIDGSRNVPLNRSVINIGRKLDNHIIIDDPRVSRNHAQLRIVKNRFVLFDLNSTGGTYVNGIRSNQSVLNPGDVVSLAGVSMVFGQDLPPQTDADKDQTRPGMVISGDQPPENKHRTGNHPE